MRLKRKAVTIPLQFLMYSIVALALFIPTVLWASSFFKLSDKSLASYNELVITISGIKEGEIASSALAISKDTLIFGVSKNADKAESYVIRPNENILEFFRTISGSKKEPGAYIDRPSECKKEKSCLCLCKKGFSIEENKITCKNKPICNSFENIDFMENRPITDITRLDFSILYTGYWKNGVFVGNTKDQDLIYGMYAVPRETKFTLYNPTTVYVQRHENFVNVCFRRECITEQIIDNLNKEKAITEFDRFKDSVDSCLKEEKCDPFVLTFPQRYYLYFDEIETSQYGGPDSIDSKLGRLTLINSEDTDKEYIKDNYETLSVKDNLGKELSINGFIESAEHILKNSVQMKKNKDTIILS